MLFQGLFEPLVMALLLMAIPAVLYAFRRLDRAAEQEYQAIRLEMAALKAGIARMPRR
ncbi:hypothetical protein [Azospirillum sp. SYSU D00513]|uniref:hypothetical protein n=1 Tax=Azospirillum sp. SYSU D00513 TaxID=2812561 RepID=UPI001A959843|nr:hypothetical protein [Azospirillum sp. SYSU D00513]